MDSVMHGRLSLTALLEMELLLMEFKEAGGEFNEGVGPTVNSNDSSNGGRSPCSQTKSWCCSFVYLL